MSAPYTKIEKLDPQPEDIHSTGWLEDGRFCVREGVMRQQAGFIPVMELGRDIITKTTPDMDDWAAGLIRFAKINGEWWLVRASSREKP